jgi:hypothetical protein
MLSRVSKDDLNRVFESCGGCILSSTDYFEDCLGSLSLFEERQLRDITNLREEA